MQSQLAGTPRKLPVFVFPQSITFFLDDQSTHKQVLTLYNPYDFPIRFRVLCTAPNKYKVVDPEGTIKARCCVDIVVRHKSPLPSNCNVVDKFRIQMQEHPTKQAIGKRDVEAKLLAGTTEATGRSTPDPEMFQQLPINESRQQQSYALIAQNKAMDKYTRKSVKLKYDLFGGNKNAKMYLSSDMKCSMDKGGTNYIALIAGIICIIGLLLPTEGERNNRVPDYLYLSINLKLIFSFVLGMVTIIILRL
ncbi:motile sperm domain-containing protein 1-like isoform X1 [Ceratina calcarata]|uniref:Motile sperm domain-containing protein 3 n=1 Tax=Ceratina calcarata TaxID=156304 RepID=A0AAJ7IVM0_9HYME|nr:motile sperm domain-containing protein 1-like isoform X1 [Ceratina calcarata]XP_017878093.1 motile sperm domain-containing protein 1-like isoform X1 [Ceratina calcarata]XP_017878101.1 motile sperm domain-containing protein 1-like isoform X1 [Ceratina calcarata]XP_017878109.1 motile sperm domain-containing protein 1-like isoform X1 [Ceratina calcarata]